MYIAPILFQNDISSNSIKSNMKFNKIKSIPSQENLMNKINKCWEKVNEKPKSRWLNKLLKELQALKEYYPESFEEYKKTFKIM